MSTPRRELGYESRSAEQQEHDAVNQYQMLELVLIHVRERGGGAVELVDLVDCLGLDELLTDLIGGDPVYTQRVREARETLGCRNTDGRIE